ncbi:MAG: hypothetical protein QM817_15445 [Archangium sp.]
MPRRAPHAVGVDPAGTADAWQAACDEVSEAISRLVERTQELEVEFGVKARSHEAWNDFAASLDQLTQANDALSQQNHRFIADKLRDQLEAQRGKKRR